MKIPVALAFGLSLFWIGLTRGKESPDTIVQDFFTSAAVLIAAAVLWEVVARVLRSRRE